MCAKAVDRVKHFANGTNFVPTLPIGRNFEPALPTGNDNGHTFRSNDTSSLLTSLAGWAKNDIYLCGGKPLCFLKKLWILCVMGINHSLGLSGNLSAHHDCRGKN